MLVYTSLLPAYFSMQKIPLPFHPEVSIISKDGGARSDGYSDAATKSATVRLQTGPAEKWGEYRWSATSRTLGRERTGSLSAPEAGETGALAAIVVVSAALMEMRARAKSEHREGSRVWACVHGGGPPVLFCLNSGAAWVNPADLLLVCSSLSEYEVITVSLTGSLRVVQATCEWTGTLTVGPLYSVRSLSALVWWTNGGLFSNCRRFVFDGSSRWRCHSYTCFNWPHECKKKKPKTNSSTNILPWTLIRMIIFPLAYWYPGRWKVTLSWTEGLGKHVVDLASSLNSYNQEEEAEVYSKMYTALSAVKFDAHHLCVVSGSFLIR